MTKLKSYLIADHCIKFWAQDEFYSLERPAYASGGKIKNGFQDFMGYHGPWYQVHRIGTDNINVVVDNLDNCYKSSCDSLSYSEKKKQFDKFCYFGT